LIRACFVSDTDSGFTCTAESSNAKHHPNVNGCCVETCNGSSNKNERVFPHPNTTSENAGLVRRIEHHRTGGKPTEVWSGAPRAWLAGERVDAWWLCHASPSAVRRRLADVGSSACLLACLLFFGHFPLVLASKPHSPSLPESCFMHQLQLHSDAEVCANKHIPIMEVVLDNTRECLTILVIRSSITDWP
jgi:hypothetical protein